MLRSGTARTATQDDARAQQSLGDLVGLALKDVSQLVRYEINLAKSEFKVDLKRAIFGAVFVAFILIVAYPLIIMLLFAYAYGLRSAGLPGGMWAAFLVVAGTCLVLAIIAGLIGLFFFKRITGMKLTRKTVSDDIGMLKRAASSDGGGGSPAVTRGSASRDSASADGAKADGIGAGRASTDSTSTDGAIAGKASTSSAPAAVTARPLSGSGESADHANRTRRPDQRAVDASFGHRERYPLPRGDQRRRSAGATAPRFP